MGTKTLVKLGGSTKSNFKFFCDPCLTKFERNIVETESQKITGLDQKVNSMEKKLDDITKLLKNSTYNSEKMLDPIKYKPQSIWQNTEKLTAVKAPPKSVLVVKKRNSSEKNEENRVKVQTTMMHHNIPIAQSFNNEAGDLVMVCESKEKRDELKNLVSSTNNDIIMNIAAEKTSLSNPCRSPKRVHQGKGYSNAGITKQIHKRICK